LKVQVSLGQLVLVLNMVCLKSKASGYRQDILLHSQMYR